MLTVGAAGVVFGADVPEPGLLVPQILVCVIVNVPELATVID
jgi:hypothetical protein